MTTMNPMSTLVAVATVTCTTIAVVAFIKSRSKQNSELALRTERRKAALEKQKRDEETRKLAESHASGPMVHCYWGSQTGSAEGFAKIVADLVRRAGFRAKTIDLSDFDADQHLFDVDPVNTIHCFLVSTYGEGDPSDNAIAFHAWLKGLVENSADVPSTAKASPPRYCVFGLGNKLYEKYCAMGRFIDSSFETLEFERVYALGEGDDNASLEDDFNAWKEELVAALVKSQLAQPGEPSAALLAAQNNAATVAPPDFQHETQYLTEKPETLLACQGRFDESTRTASAANAKLSLSTKAYYKTVPLKVTAIRELRQRVDNPANGAGSTLHIEIESKPNAYATAHNLSICPENDPALVEKCAELLGLDLDAWISVRPNKENKEQTGPLFPSPCTIRTALSCYCALSAATSQSVLEKLAFLTSDAKAREELLHLASKEGRAEFHAQIASPGVNIVELMAWKKGFVTPETQAQPTRFFEIVHRLSPRDYTLASSNKLHPTSMHVVASMVTESAPDWNGQTNREIHGVCTHALRRRFLQAQKQEAIDPIYAFVKASTFVMPAHPATPIILIGPGTGYAPMRALVQERAWQKQQNKRPGPCLVFFGSRHKDEDWIYRDEMKDYEAQGIISGLFLAFSRDDPKKKVYVTDRLKEQASLVWDYVYNRGAHIYVCGGTTMGRDVGHALEGIAQAQGKLSEEDAKKLIADLHAESRYTQELWS